MNQATLNRRAFAARLAGHAVLLSALVPVLSACQDRSAVSPGHGADVASGAESASAEASQASGRAGQQAYELAAGAPGSFSVGALMAAHIAYVFFDPNCPHCAELWNASKPLAGKLKMVWIPVALLGKTSAPLGATLLSAPDPAAAMAEHERSLLARQGGIVANTAASGDVLAKVQANTELFQRLKADSVPLIVFRNARTGAHGQHAGSLATAELAALVGV
ncbi:MAG: DsbC family protein [Rubrivivax sp.]|nr:MAG: DsbC family protein [Rubrivivax sp.]